MIYIHKCYSLFSLHRVRFSTHASRFSAIVWTQQLQRLTLPASALLSLAPSISHAFPWRDQDLPLCSIKYSSKKTAMPTNEGFQDYLNQGYRVIATSVAVKGRGFSEWYCTAGVSNCYVFKSRLQEYAQKVGLPTPVYETIKEGPSHEPSFRSTVIVNDVKYDSLPGFFNRKAAEQSAAEVALLELAKSCEVNQSISQPVHETGLCKNLLQEYAQKMNYAIPLYQCQKDETPGRVPLFLCTIEIGGIRYIGAAAKTKKEAEIKAARTALLAIQSITTQSSEKPFLNSQLTVIPSKKRGTKSVNDIEEAANPPKAKKARFKKKMLKKKLSGDKVGNSHGENAGTMESLLENNGPESDQIDAAAVQEAGMGMLSIEAIGNPQNVRSYVSSSEKEISAGEGALAQQVNGNYENGKSSASNSNLNNDSGAFSIFSGDMTVLTKEMNEVSEFGDIASVADSATMGHVGASSVQPA